MQEALLDVMEKKQTHERDTLLDLIVAASGDAECQQHADGVAVEVGCRCKIIVLSATFKYIGVCKRVIIKRNNQTNDTYIIQIYLKELTI